MSAIKRMSIINANKELSIKGVYKNKKKKEKKSRVKRFNKMSDY